MAELYYVILKTLFSEFDKLARVRHTMYEMNLNRDHGLPMSKVSQRARAYFVARFLEGKPLPEATDEEMRGAFVRLSNAESLSGCRGVCLRLIDELNEVLASEGLLTVRDVDKFIDLMTFDARPRIDEATGMAMVDERYGIPILDFADSKNRRTFRVMRNLLRAEKRMMSMQDIWLFIEQMRAKAKIVE